MDVNSFERKYYKYKIKYYLALERPSRIDTDNCNVLYDKIRTSTRDKSMTLNNKNYDTYKNNSDNSVNDFIENLCYQIAYKGDDNNYNTGIDNPNFIIPNEDVSYNDKIVGQYFSIPTKAAREYFNDDSKNFDNFYDSLGAVVQTKYKGKNVLRVLSYNVYMSQNKLRVHNPKSTNDNLQDIVSRIRPDILFLQEHCDRIEFKGYNELLYDTEERACYNNSSYLSLHLSMFFLEKYSKNYRDSVHNLDSDYRKSKGKKLIDYGDERGAIIKFITIFGEDFLIATVHLDPFNDDARKEEVKFLINILNNYTSENNKLYVIIIGDFNDINVNKSTFASIKKYFNHKCDTNNDYKVYKSQLEKRGKLSKKDELIFYKEKIKEMSALEDLREAGYEDLFEAKEQNAPAFTCNKKNSPDMIFINSKIKNNKSLLSRITPFVLWNTYSDHVPIGFDIAASKE